VVNRKRPLLYAPELAGRQYAQAHSDQTDRWLKDIFDSAVAPDARVALVAVGGYGRSKLCPFSDIDVWLVHDGVDDYADIAEAIWYPVWDRGLKIGYAVVDLEQAYSLARNELHWATALLSPRLVAGQSYLFDELTQITSRVWASDEASLLDQLARSVEHRDKDQGDVAFQIEPRLKHGRGGLRDVHAVGWAQCVIPGFADGHLEAIESAADFLLQVRVELHRLVGRPNDVLSLDLQDEVAAQLGYQSANDLMVTVATAGRTVAWSCNEVWSRWRRKRQATVASGEHHRPGSAGSHQIPPSPFTVDNGVIGVSPKHKPEFLCDPFAPLRLGLQAARSQLVMDRDLLSEIGANPAPLPDVWTTTARREFSDLLLAGRPTIDVIEDLDRFDLVTHLIPQWRHVRCRPQRNVLHTWTVDRHLTETAVTAGQLADRVDRPDLLVVGAFLHDIGKGIEGDHTENGMELITTIASVMGYPEQDIAILVDLCRHHLLLADVAIRRDLSDPGTIAAVAAAVDTTDFIDLLAALTEADSISTGPSAWGEWKAGLLAALVERTKRVLEGAAPASSLSSQFPTPAIKERMDNNARWVDHSGGTLTVVAPNTPDLFSRVAGALAISGFEVLDASAHSDNSVVASQFNLQLQSGSEVDWPKIVHLVNQALDGKLALTARVGRAAQRYGRFKRKLAATPPRIDIVIDNEISESATVLEVHAPDSVGLLYYLTQALKELRLNIRSAKIQTFGPQAVDSFYVCDADDHKITDIDLLAEIELALRYVVGTETI